MTNINTMKEIAVELQRIIDEKISSESSIRALCSAYDEQIAEMYNEIVGLRKNMVYLQVALQNALEDRKVT